MLEAEFESVKKLVEEANRKEPARGDGLALEVAEAARKRSKLAGSTAFLTDFDRRDEDKDLYPNYSRECRMRDAPEDASDTNAKSHAWSALVNKTSRARASTFDRKERQLRRTASFSTTQ